ncbi:hypothetical protein PIROE2DRAFT_14670 [Piromyces sp. E2]|nr:hypothetical protein PIROE2DRAFT_14670 [Piromyces sp. E2]|eukprot:OUM59731.1 hypothetical protein PIROE2DRAFT_14670 [Piromyces sp. E2]
MNKYYDEGDLKVFDEFNGSSTAYEKLILKEIRTHYKYILQVVREGKNLLTNTERKFYKTYITNEERIKALKKIVINKEGNIEYFDFEINDNGEIENVRLKEEYSTDGKTLKLQYANKKDLFNSSTGEMKDEVSDQAGCLKSGYQKKSFLKEDGSMDEEKFQKVNGKYVLKREEYGKNVEECSKYFYNNGELMDGFGKYDSEGKIEWNSDELIYYNNSNVRKIIDEYFDKEWELKEEYGSYICKKDNSGNPITRYILKEKYRGDKNINKYYNEIGEKVQSEFDEKGDFPKDHAPSVFHYINYNGELKEPFKEKFFKNDQNFDFSTLKFKDGDGTIKTLASVLFSDYSKRLKNTMVFDFDDDIDDNVVYKHEKLVNHLYYKNDVEQFIVEAENKRDELEQKMRKFSLYTFKTYLKFEDGDKVTINYSIANCSYQANLRKKDFRNNYDKILTTYIDLKYPPEITKSSQQKYEEKVKVIHEYEYENKLEKALSNEFIFSKDLSGVMDYIELKINENNSNNEINENKLKFLLDHLVNPVNGRKTPKKYFNGLGELNVNLRDDNGNLKKKNRPKIFFEIEENGEYKYLKRENGKLIIKNEYRDNMKEICEEESNELFENGTIKDQYMDENGLDLKEIYRDGELSTLYDHNGVLKDQFKIGNKLKIEYNYPLISDYFKSNGELREEEALFKEGKKYFYSDIRKFVDINSGALETDKLTGYIEETMEEIKLKVEYREPKGYFDKNKNGEYKYLEFDENEKKLKIRSNLSNANKNQLKDFGIIKNEFFDRHGTLKVQYYNDTKTDINDKYINSSVSRLFNGNGDLNNELFMENQSQYYLKQDKCLELLNSQRVESVRYDIKCLFMENQILTEFSNLCIHILRLLDFSESNKFLYDVESFDSMISDVIENYHSFPKVKMLGIEVKKRNNYGLDYKKYYKHYTKYYKR